MKGNSALYNDTTSVLMDVCARLFIVLMLSSLVLSTSRAYAVDFGISTSEREVTVSQNQFSSPLELNLIRKDFDGPVNIDVQVDGVDNGVEVFVQDSKSLKGGNKPRDTIDINIGTRKYVENGSYEVTVTASGTVNGEPRTRVATFTVNVQREDSFEISVAPGKVSLPQGSVTNTTVNIQDLGQFTDPVYLEIGGRSLTGFSFDFSGNNGNFSVANDSDKFVGSQHWTIQPDKNGKSASTLTITTYPDTVPGEYTFHVYGRRDMKKTVEAVASGRGTKSITVETSSTRRAAFKVTVTADPVFIDLIEPVEFSLTTEKTRMVTEPSGYPHMNEIYVSAVRSLNTIKLEARLETDVPGISVAVDSKRVKPEVGPNMLLVAVTEAAPPGTYYAIIKATSRGANNKTLAQETRVEIIVPDKSKTENKKVSIANNKAIKVNCVGNSCPATSITANCTGASCPEQVSLSCSSGICPQSLDLLCLENTCPSNLNTACNANECDANYMNFLCGNNGCTATAGESLISNLQNYNPVLVNVNCSGQGCADTDIIAYCYGSSCPASIDMSCTGSGCVNTIELSCYGSSCSNNFSYDCSGDYCPSQLQYDCEGLSCTQLSNPYGKLPYLTGASPSSTPIVLPSGYSSNAPENKPAEVKPVVTEGGSSEAIPASSADLQAITAAANAIAANAGLCLDAECPIIDCATAAILLQGLINAEANLDEMYKWLIVASDDALAHLLSLQASDILTAEMLSQAQNAQALHQYLHRIGSLLLDLAAISSTLKNVAKGDLDDASKLKQLDTAYETLKDMESAVSTVGEAYETKTPKPASNLTGAVIGALGGDSIPDATGASKATPEKLGDAVNDMKSQINDAIDAINDAKDGKTPVEAVGKMIGRILKTVSAAKIEERKALIADYMENLDKNAGPIASSMAFLQKTNNRRFATEDALKAIRAAKDALLACMAKACDAASLTRPAVATDFSGWGSALKHFNGLIQGLHSGMNGSFSVKDQCPGTETAISLFTGAGFQGGPGAVSIGTNTSTTAIRTVTAKCPRCQPIADKLAKNLTETDYWRAEKAAIEEKLSQAETLRERKAILERRRASNRRAIASMSKSLGEAEAFGFNWGPGLAIMLKEAEARSRDLQRQATEMEREIARLEADKGRIETIEDRLSELRYKRSRLREDLSYCEETWCKQYDRDNEAVGRLFGTLFGVEVVDVKNVSGNNPYDRRDPLDEETDGGTGSGGGGTSFSLNVSCDINSGSGTQVLSVNGSPTCTVSGLAPQINGGTINSSCSSGSTVTITGTCSATECRAFANAFSGLSCPFGTGNFLSGTFGGAAGYTGAAAVNCTCQ